MTKTKSREWWVVYHDRDPSDPHLHWAKWLKPGFRHVELTQPIWYGNQPDQCFWNSVLPSMELLDVELSTDPRSPRMKCPQSAIQRVKVIRPLYSTRSLFDIGPPSCVEVAKMVLGIRALFVRTPWQLYQYIEKRGRVISG